MIGLCIKYFHENYGGMLQALATVTYFKRMGLKYELVQYEKCYSKLEKIKQLPRLLNGILINDKKEAFLKKMGAKKHPEFLKNDAIRLKSFADFKDRYFTELSPVFKGYKALCDGANRYSAVVSGSDQLWSPAGLPTNYYNLMFVPDSIRKISVASSFGVKQIPWYQKKRTAEFLNRIEFVSMRENRGSEIVEELTSRKVPTILDPVFLLSKDDWARLIPEKKELYEPYIFAYFLGAEESYRTAVKLAAQKLGCKIVALRHLDQYVPSDESFGDYAPYDVDPARFLNLLRGAKYVCTDSFHGSVFSIIHQKNFVTFNRYKEGSKHSKNSRIDTLCGNLGLQDRRFKNNCDLEKLLVAPIDYDSVFQKFVQLKKRTDEFLNEAFNGIE
ncbi:polysaccharide pyruvyl transferase family protein [Fibrobacter sp. UWS1]|uniref:polysaccharide pyruvyl transferase family protein n=1 Tax=Fibrobacter sp. UWS1 TaxID=1896220 RepID=UPI000BD9587A|nr:polysaccharide pyruvyl transferase family protein [Fibrobacter sp. UWS1]PBC67170.1 polysaccharide pyruvyl transferase [Fibrobacter sp. UWS1]